MDYGHKWTDDELKKLEKRIAKEYKQAEKEVQVKLDDYLRRFEIKDRIKQQAFKDGKITKQEYTEWRTGQIMIGKRWEEMKNTLAQDIHKTNEKVASMTREFSYDAYALNHNYGTFEVEKGSLIDTSYTLYDRHTVERLVRDNPDMLPPPGKRVSKRIREGKDVLWNKQQIQSVMTQSILQGEPIPQIANRLAAAVGDSNHKAAIRNARTMTTGAENAGREDSYIRAENMGIQMEQMWIATLDGRTRHEHRQLDGVKVPVGKPFQIDGYTLRFPADPTAAPHLVYNCRCTLIGVVAGTKLAEDGLGSVDRKSRLKSMSYDEWKNEHKKQSQQKSEKSIFEVTKEYDARMDALNQSVEKKQEEYQDLLQKQMMSFGTPEFDTITKQIEEYNETFPKMYDELNAIREEKIKYLSQCGEEEIRKVIGTIDKEHSIKDDLWATNRLEAGDARSYNNCGYCALAYDARRRNIDCKAPYIYGANDTLVSGWWEGFKYQPVGIYDPHDAANAIAKIAEEWGVGARGIVSIDHSGGIGHTFGFEVDENGKCRFIDAQTGIIDAKDAFDTAVSGSVRFGRTDDKKLTKSALFYLEKGGWGDDKYS